MAVADNYVPTKTLGNGATVEFTAAWNVIAAAYIRVYLENVTTGIQVLQVKDTDYSLTFGDSGLTVDFTIGTTPPSTEYVIIARAITQDQVAPYKTSQGFQGAVVENSYDKITSIAQDIQDQVDRSLKFPIASSKVGILPSPEDGATIVWSGTGGTMVNGPTVAEIEGASASADAAAASAASASASASSAGVSATAAAASAAIANQSGVISPIGFGGAGNLVTNDAVPVANTLASASSTKHPMQFYQNLSNSSHNIAAGVTIQGGKLLSTVTSANSTTIGGAGVTISEVEIYNNGATSGHGIAFPTNSADNTIINSSRITSENGYGILDNGSNINGLIISNSYIKAFADVVAVNHPSSTGKNSIVNACILEVLPGGVGHTAGFAYSVAEGKGWMFANSHVKYSRNEVIHIEDNQERGVVSNITCESCDYDGILIINPTSGDYDPVLINNVNIKHTGTKTTYTGFFPSETVDGAPRITVCHSSFMNGFGIGFYTGNRSISSLSGSIASDCNTALKLQGNAVCTGTLLSEDTTALVNSDEASFVDRVVSRTQVTSVLTSTAAAGRLGSVIKSFNVPFSAVHAGTGVEQFVLFPVATRLNGKFTITVQGGANNRFLVADYTWDGTTLTQISGTLMTKANGTMSTVGLNVSGSDLRISISTTTAATYECKIDFAGAWYVGG